MLGAMQGIIPQVENPVGLVENPVKRSQFEVAARFFIIWINALRVLLDRLTEYMWLRPPTHTGQYPKLPLTVALNKHHQVPGALEGARGLKSSTRRKAQVVNADWCKTLSISMSEEKNKKPVLGLGLLMRQGLSLQMRVVTACRRTLVQGSAPGRGECHVRPLIPNMPVP
jgi:hypothetical protein